MTTILQVVQAVQDQMLAVTGIKNAPDYVPENAGAYPLVITYPERGTVLAGSPAGVKRGLHNIVIEVHVKAADLGSALRVLMPLFDNITDKLCKDTTLGGVVSTFGGIEYTLGALGLGGVNTVGWRFTLLDVKVDNILT